MSSSHKPTRYQSTKRKRCGVCEEEVDNRGYAAHVRSCQKKADTAARYRELNLESEREERANPSRKHSEYLLRNDSIRSLTSLNSRYRRLGRLTLRV
jgi:hypothetical protein